MEKMSRKLIIEGNAVYEVDEECMLRRRVDDGKDKRDKSDGVRKDNKRENRNEWPAEKMRQQGVP